MTPEQLAQYKQYVLSQGLTPEQADQYIAYAMKQEANAAPVEQVQSPMVSAKDRLLIKNLAQSPEVGMKYLQQKNPSAQVRVQNGEIQIKNPGDKAWNVVDPDTGLFSSDILNDAGDIIYDIGSGIGQSLATTAGAAAGTLLGPAGTVGGGMAASGASSAGLEAARQKLGAELGLPQEVDLGDVAGAGAAGVISQGLLGGGGAKGGIQKAYELAKEKVLPRLGQMVSGVPKEAISHYAGNMSRIDGLEQEGITDLIQGVTDKAQKAAGGYKSRAGKAVSEAIKNADEAVDIAPAKSSFINRINELKSKANLTNADLDEIKTLERAFKKMFGTVDGEIPDAIPGDRAFDLQQRLKQLAQFEQGMTPETAAMKGSARGAYSAINQGLDDVTGRVSSAAKENYRKALDAEDFIEKQFKNPDTTYRTLSNLDKKSRQLVVERLKKYSDDGLLDIGQEAKDIQAYKYFSNPALNPMSMQNTTSPIRSIPLAGLGAGLGYYVGANSGIGQGGAGVGAGVGALLGSKAGSAAAIKKLIKAGTKSESAIKKMIPNLPFNVPIASPAAAWMYMNSAGEPQEVIEP